MSAYHRKSKTGRATGKEEPRGTRISGDMALSLEATR